MRLIRSIAIPTGLALISAIAIGAAPAQAAEGTPKTVTEMKTAFESALANTMQTFESTSGTVEFGGTGDTGATTEPLTIELAQDAVKFSQGELYIYATPETGIVSLNQVKLFNSATSKQILKEAKVSSSVTAAEFSWGDGSEVFLDNTEQVWLFDALRMTALYFPPLAGESFVTTPLTTNPEGATVTVQSLPDGSEKWVFEKAEDFGYVVALRVVDFVVDANGMLVSAANGYYDVNTRNPYGNVTMEFEALGATVPQPRAETVASLEKIGAAAWRVDTANGMKTVAKSIASSPLPKNRKAAVKSVQSAMKKAKAANWKYSSLPNGGSFRATDPTGKVVQYTVQVVGKKKAPKVSFKRTR